MELFSDTGAACSLPTAHSYGELSGQGKEDLDNSLEESQEAWTCGVSERISTAQPSEDSVEDSESEIPKQDPAEDLKSHGFAKDAFLLEHRIALPNTAQVAVRCDTPVLPCLYGRSDTSLSEDSEGQAVKPASTPEPVGQQQWAFRCAPRVQWQVDSK